MTKMYGRRNYLRKECVKAYSVSLVLGVLLSVLLSNSLSANDNSGYRFLNPVRGHEVTMSQPSLHELSIKLDKSFADMGVDHSYYFEELHSGHSIQKNSNNAERAASLTKLLVVMDLYKKAELNEINLNQEVVIQKNWLNSSFGNLWQKGAGSKITLGEAAKLSLTESDNTAINVVKYFDTQSPGGENVIDAVGAPPQLQYSNLYISSKDYSSYFKCLYFSCYLSRTDSETLLKYLSETRFQGIPTGLPINVKVAHKIGETSHLYSDCGIVYSPQDNYVLCSMINDLPLKSINETARISDITYSAVTARH